MQWSIAINTGNTSGLYGKKKKWASWSSVDNGPLMKRKRENDLWFWFYEFLMKTIHAETHLYKIVKGAVWNYSRKLTPPQLFAFSSEIALWTAPDSGGRSSRSGEILQISNFFDNHSKDFFRIMHHKAGQHVDQECVNICFKKTPVRNNGLFWSHKWHPQNSESTQESFLKFTMMKGAKKYMKIILIVFLKKILLWKKWAILCQKITCHYNYI